MTDSRRILVTAALPYANGLAHMGHLVEYIQTDIWVRFQRMLGNDCLFVCASDAHGTPIMIRARKDGIAAEEIIEHYHQRFQEDFAAFHIRFDNFGSTHSSENRELVNLIYGRLQSGGHLQSRTIRQAYDEKEGMFLPDRFVRGTCPRCGTADQYGDSCESCGATYAPSELVDPISILSATRPVERESEHLFFRLSAFEDALRAGPRAARSRTACARSSMSGSRRGCRIGISVATPPTSASKSRTCRASTSTSGWMPRSGTWRAC